MKYALGNMLNGAGGLNADQLALDLRFAADKTLTARKGPTPVFTRASSGTFVGSNGLIQTAPLNEPRFDHDPITLACRGLLIEESRTNLALRSEEFENATWAKTQSSVSNNTTTSPSGSTNADTLIEDSATSLHFISQQTTKAASSITYSFSVYYKNASGTRNLTLALTNGTSAGKAAIFTTSGSVTATNVNIGTGAGFTFVSADATAVNNSWYRASIVVTSDTATRLDAVIYLNNSSTNVVSYAGNGTSGIFLWGAQLEAGAFPTSYIPTTTASVVRSADVCTITGANFTSFYNQSEGTVYAESRSATVNGITTTFSLSNSTANERWLNRFAQNEQVVITSAGVEANLDALNPVAGTLYKVATAGKLNDFAMSINGLAVVTDTSQPMPVVDRAGIGNSTGTNTAGAVTIASLRYYKKRLPNAKLVTLTA